MSWIPVKHKALTYERLKEFLQNTGYTGVSPETEIKTLNPPDNKQCLRKDFFTLDNFNYVHSNDEQGIYIKKYSVGSSEENASTYNENLIVIEPDIAYYMPLAPQPTELCNIYILALNGTTYNGTSYSDTNNPLVITVTKGISEWTSGTFAPPSGKQGTFTVTLNGNNYTLQDNRVILLNIVNDLYLVSSFTEEEQPNTYWVRVYTDAHSTFAGINYSSPSYYLSASLSEGSTWEDGAAAASSGYKIKTITCTPTSENFTNDNGSLKITNINQNYTINITSEQELETTPIDIEILRIENCFDINVTPKLGTHFLFINSATKEPIPNNNFVLSTESNEGNYYFTVQPGESAPTTNGGTKWTSAQWIIKVYWNGGWHDFTNSLLCITPYYNVGHFDNYTGCNKVLYELPLGLSASMPNTLKITTENSNNPLSEIVLYLGDAENSGTCYLVLIPNNVPGIIITPAGPDTTIKYTGDGEEILYSSILSLELLGTKITINSDTKHTCNITVDLVTDGIIVHGISTRDYWRTHCTITKVFKDGQELTEGIEFLTKEISFNTYEKLSASDLSLSDLYWKASGEPAENYETFLTSFLGSLYNLFEEGTHFEKYELSCSSENDCTNCTLSLTSAADVTPDPPGPDHPDDPDTSVTKSIRWRRKYYELLGVWNHKDIVTINTEDGTKEWWPSWEYPYVNNYGDTVDNYIMISATLFHQEVGEEDAVDRTFTVEEGGSINFELEFGNIVDNDTLDKYYIEFDYIDKDSDSVKLDDSLTGCTITIGGLEGTGTLVIYQAGQVTANKPKISDTNYDSDKYPIIVNYTYCLHSDNKYIKSLLPQNVVLTSVSGENVIQLTVKDCDNTRLINIPYTT